MIKQIIIPALVAGTLLVSCKKSTTTPQAQTPLQAAIDSKYVHTGLTSNDLIVEYASYNSTADVDKKVYDAAVQTVQGNYNINSITINGANLTMEFDRDSSVMPSKISLTTGTSLYKAVNQIWPWKGLLTIHKQNTLLTAQQFQADISVKVAAVNTGDIAEITSNTTNGDYMSVEYELSKFSTVTAESVQFQVQASTPITLTSQFEISCIIPGFYDTQTNVVVDYAKSLQAPTQTSVGNNTTSYDQEVFASWTNLSLSESIAAQYFTKNVYPIVK